MFLRTGSKFVFLAATVETASLALTTRVIRESTVTTWGTMTPCWRENKSRKKVVREWEINTLGNISLNEYKSAYKASHTVHIHHSASILAHPVREISKCQLIYIYFHTLTKKWAFTLDGHVSHFGQCLFPADTYLSQTLQNLRRIEKKKV